MGSPLPIQDLPVPSHCPRQATPSPQGPVLTGTAAGAGGTMLQPGSRRRRRSPVFCRGDRSQCCGGYAGPLWAVFRFSHCLPSSLPSPTASLSTIVPQLSFPQPEEGAISHTLQIPQEALGWGCGLAFCSQELHRQSGLQRPLQVRQDGWLGAEWLRDQWQASAPSQGAVCVSHSHPSPYHLPPSPYKKPFCSWCDITGRSPHARVSNPHPPDPRPQVQSPAHSRSYWRCWC